MSDKIEHLTAESFETAIATDGVPVLVDFWAEWCGPCHMVAPILEEIAGEKQGEVRIAKLNVDEFPQISDRYGVRGIPTMILFKEGQEKGRIVGAAPKEQLLSKLTTLL